MRDLIVQIHQAPQTSSVYSGVVLLPLPMPTTLVNGAKISKLLLLDRMDILYLLLLQSTDVVPPPR
jgi:hypothetical protein